MGTQDEVKVTDIKGQEAVILEVQVEDLSFVNALSQQASHGVKQQEGLADPSDADEGHNFARTEGQLQLSGPSFRELALVELHQDVFDSFLVHRERIAGFVPSRQG